MATIAPPTATDVGTMYDSYTDVLTDNLGGFIHVGYWPNPETAEETVDVATERLTREVADRLSTSPGQHILDVGCGTGKPAAQIAASYNVKITGITVSNHQVDVAQAAYDSLIQTGKLNFQLADAMKLPFENATFDGAYAIEALGHMDDRRAALSNIARVLRPGSRLSISDLVLDAGCPNPEVLARWQDLFQVRAVMMGDELKELLHQTGFKVIEYTDVRENIRPIYKHLEKKAPFLGAEVGEKLRDMAHTILSLKEMGYVFITAERL